MDLALERVQRIPTNTIVVAFRIVTTLDQKLTRHIQALVGHVGIHQIQNQLHAHHLNGNVKQIR